MLRKIAKTAVVGLLLTGQPTFADQVKKPTRSKEIECLALNIYHEARDQPLEGQIAVGLVTLNRTKHNKFPNSICKVVYERTKSNGRKFCQFSWVCQKPRAPKSNDPIWIGIQQLSAKIINGEYPKLSNRYSQVKYFHSTRINPKWKRKRLAKIGQHVFY